MIEKLTEECTENINEVKIADENKCVFSYTICIVLAVIALEIRIGIGAYFAYSRKYLKKDATHIKFGTRTQWNSAQKNNLMKAIPLNL